MRILHTYKSTNNGKFCEMPEKDAGGGRETGNLFGVALKCAILGDVARGLLYLHKRTPQIIHRDITAKNVLLTSSLVGKITDLGNSRIVNVLPGQLAQTLSRNPGTLVYMPPEALTAAARYGPSLDIFSFGHLGIFVGLQVYLITVPYCSNFSINTCKIYCMSDSSSIIRLTTVTVFNLGINVIDRYNDIVLFSNSTASHVLHTCSV